MQRGVRMRHIHILQGPLTGVLLVCHWLVRVHRDSARISRLLLDIQLFFPELESNNLAGDLATLLQGLAAVIACAGFNPNINGMTKKTCN